MSVIQGCSSNQCRTYHSAKSTSINLRFDDCFPVLADLTRILLDEITFIDQAFADSAPQLLRLLPKR
jgi:hypothetical protein